MPEELKELTDSQRILLDLLFLPENRDEVIKGNWKELMAYAGYAPNSTKQGCLNSKLFREEFETRVAHHFTSLQLQAVNVVEDVLAGRNLTPMSQVQLAAARDTMDRTGKLVKRTEQKISQDLGGAIVLMPAKEELPDDDV